MRRYLALLAIGVLLLTLVACQTQTLVIATRSQEPRDPPRPDRPILPVQPVEEQPEYKEEPISQAPEVSLVAYKGVVEHIFIHPLIPYPEVTFKSREGIGFDDWFITVTEFKRILPELYNRGFILVDINDVYEEVVSNGKPLMRRKELRLPEGKKPLILSIDDLNYYKYMIESGLVHRLVFDDTGEIAAYAKSPEGQVVISRDIEVIPILNDFVKLHPDFSHNGARGIIALTGYEGILGYRTHTKHAHHQTERELVAPIVARLKETGWTFASHSYGHSNSQNMTYNHFVSDTRQWKQEVELLVGPTQVYIYPFGARVAEGSDKFLHLQSQGFRILCAVGPTSYEKISTRSSAVMTDRRHVDGLSLRQQRHHFLDLYDANNIIDLEARPKR